MTAAEPMRASQAKLRLGVEVLIWARRGDGR